MTSWVLPGVDEVFASPLRPVSMFMREDFPTLERPMKANSGSPEEVLWETLVLLPAKVASVIIIGLAVLKGSAKIAKKSGSAEKNAYFCLKRFKWLWNKKL